ncbi:hypothetical protein [Pleomorphomonas sp. NRK KF1]|uniref:hypothetical protein n=1 Tax=Pleomorphomonas sp. NRK KF1 TaxID=2943000 RepID=UPI002043A0F3|nr:hypothetical protein [Pleomorphomonas sp. NRK KF1]MCM5552409.1 hypothetical protein [Pleomorphomonas sp. NRK KF1]
MTDLLDGMDAQELQPETLSKKGFAAHLGLSPGRVSQLIAQGLPVEPSGRVNIEKATGWYRRNVDPNRRQATTGADDRRLIGSRGEYDRIRAERARLALDRESGALVDRAAVERAVFDRARGERDAWIGWSSRAAAAFAGELGVDPGQAFAVLDRLVRDQLAALAARPMAEF